MDYNMREAILAVLEKNSRIDLADLAALLGVTEAVGSSVHRKNEIR